MKTKAKKFSGYAAEIMGQIAGDAPSIHWSAEQLGEYVKKYSRQTAEDAWRIGRAIELYKSRNLAHGEYEQWVRTYLPFGTRTADRYRKVGKLDYADVQGRSLGEIYTILFDDSPAKKKAKKKAEAKAARQGQEFDHLGTRSVRLGGRGQPGPPARTVRRPRREARTRLAQERMTSTLS